MGSTPGSRLATKRAVSVWAGPLIFLVALLLVCSCRWPAVEKDGQSVPNNLKIVAQYGAGHSAWSSWKYTITGDGKVIEDIIEESGKRHEMNRTISDQNVDDLIAKVEEATFEELREFYGFRVTDNPSLSLSITRNGKTHKVRVYAPDYLTEDKQVQRFLRVWDEILRKVPSPNPKQKPGHPHGEPFGQVIG
jgi:hypothetical protein